MSALVYAAGNDSSGYRDLMVNHPRDLKVQLVLSAALGVSAFLTFCVCTIFSRDSLLRTHSATQVLRPKWTELYGARKQKTNAAARLPELPKSMFGWIPVVYKISDIDVLASAGLDAFAVRLKCSWFCFPFPLTGCSS